MIIAAVLALCSRSYAHVHTVSINEIFLYRFYVNESKFFEVVYGVYLKIKNYLHA
jgi:hypothetical protein